MKDIYDVIIIGGGWSGILACKYMVTNGLKTILLEGTDDIGGVFKYRPEATEVGGVIQSTHTTSSKSVTEMSDFPMPEDYPSFPSHRQIYQYLNSYIEHFDLRKYMHMNIKIQKVEKINDEWHVEDQNGNQYVSKNLIICSGVHQFPDKTCMLEDERFKHANVEMMHSAAYKKLTDKYNEKNILMYGGGETASDLAAELCPVADKVIVSIAHGQWLVNRYRRSSQDLSDPVLLDAFSSRLRFLFDPSTKPMCGQFLVEYEGGKCGHGIKEWINDSPYWGQFFNKSGHIVHFIPLGSLVPKGEVESVINGEATFTDGSKEKVDMIIFCTGYKTKFPFLVDEKYIKPTNEKFKFIFDNDDPSVAFIGFARPVVGSIPALAELQSLYVAKIFSKKLALPNKEEREKIIEHDKMRQAKNYAKTSRRITGLVNFPIYADELATLSGIMPNYFKLFLSSPRKWLKAVSAPYNNCQFLLNDPTRHEKIFKTFERYTHPDMKPKRHIYALIINLFPGLFLGKSKVMDFFKDIFTFILWIIFMPIIIIRIILARRR